MNGVRCKLFGCIARLGVWRREELVKLKALPTTGSYEIGKVIVMVFL